MLDYLPHTDRGAADTMANKNRPKFQASRNLHSLRTIMRIIYAMVAFGEYRFVLLFLSPIGMETRFLYLHLNNTVKSPCKLHDCCDSKQKSKTPLVSTVHRVIGNTQVWIQLPTISPTPYGPTLLPAPHVQLYVILERREGRS